ncbi:MAG: hypothetical protein LBR79_06305 [Oscillospiraceae bacterium]|nr:hypothetical protein [Oscillospiraceae bacterium]
MQSRFLSDAFFDSLRSVRFTDRSNLHIAYNWCIIPSIYTSRVVGQIC